MSWIDLVEGSEFVRELFPNSPPSLMGICLHEIQLHRDGPEIVLRFDLSQFPDQLPKKWRGRSGNRLQMKFLGSGVTSLLIDGWVLNCVGDLHLERSESGRVMRLETDCVKIKVSCGHVFVDNVNMYLDGSGD
jgi:hypothetical protein